MHYAVHNRPIWRVIAAIIPARRPRAADFETVVKHWHTIVVRNELWWCLLCFDAQSAAPTMISTTRRAHAADSVPTWTQLNSPALIQKCAAYCHHLIIQTDFAVETRVPHFDYNIFVLLQNIKILLSIPEFIIITRVIVLGFLPIVAKWKIWMN